MYIHHCITNPVKSTNRLQDENISYCLFLLQFAGLSVAEMGKLAMIVYYFSWPNKTSLSVYILNNLWEIGRHVWNASYFSEVFMFGSGKSIFKLFFVWVDGRGKQKYIFESQALKPGASKYQNSYSRDLTASLNTEYSFKQNHTFPN